MERFNKAFRNFQKTGCFTLEDAPVTLNQLRDIHNAIKKYKIHSNATVSCQFYLKDIEIIYRYTSPSSKIQRSVLTGALTDEERPQGERQFSLGQWDEAPYSTDTLSFEEQKQKLEEALIAVLTTFPSIWHTIHIEEVYFSDKKQLSDKFSSNLLKDLRKNINGAPASNLAVLTLKDFTIDPIDLNDLTKINPSLKSLQLRSTRFDSYFLQDLLPSLYLHPCLETLEILGHNLTRIGYSALHQLFDNNYQIKQLLLENPSADAVTQEYHSNLLLRLEQGNKQRFKYEQLNQKKLIAMTERAIVDKNSNKLDVLLKQPNSLLSIRSGQEKTLSEVYEVLPAIYCSYPTYMENLWSQTFINLNAPFTEGNTAGEYLLEKAFEVEDVESIKLLLEPGLGQLKNSKRLNTFLIKKLFEDKKASFLQALILNYFNQDLSTFSPWVNQLLTHHLGIQSSLNELKQHLNNYLNLLVNRNSWSPLRKKIQQVYKLLDDRKKEWELDFQNLIGGTQKAGEEELLYKSFRILDGDIEKIIMQASDAKRGLLHRSELHGKASRLSKHLLQQIRDYCDAIVDDQRKEIVELKKYQAELQELNVNLQKKLDKKNIDLDEKLKTMEKARVQDKEKLEASAKKQEQKLRAEMEASAKSHEKKMEQLYQLIKHSLPSSITSQPATTAPSSDHAANKRNNTPTLLFKP